MYEGIIGRCGFNYIGVTFNGLDYLNGTGKEIVWVHVHLC